MNVAAFRLTNSPSQEVRAASGVELEGMLADSRVSLYAVRSLLVDSIRRGDHAKAQRFAEKLGSLPEHLISDDLVCLESVISASAAFRAQLEKVKHRAETNAQWIADAGAWLNAHSMAAETLGWFGKLPEEMRSRIPVQMTAAESYLVLKDWGKLGAFLAKLNWGECEFMRRAIAIRCQRELAQPWKEKWNRLLTDLDAKPHDALLLAQTTIGWKWREETIDILWGPAMKPGAKSEALQLLWVIYAGANDTRALLRVAKAQLEFDPLNPNFKNNVAFLTLLLNRVSPPVERLAEEASKTNPAIPEWAATYAYALHLSGKDSEAAAVMKHLSSEALQRPGISLYYAIVLAANRDYAAARAFFGKLNTAGMLPEERDLVADLSKQLKGEAH